MVFIPEKRDTVHKTISMQRWERQWFDSHKSINFSGLVTEMARIIIQRNDPVYYEQYKHLIKSPKRIDNIQPILEMLIRTNTY